MSEPENHDETAVEKLFLEQARDYYYDLWKLVIMHFAGMDFNKPKNSP